MKYFLLSILVLFELGRLSAQSFVGKLNPYPATVERAALADDTLKILAIMVNFQEDADGTTSGNGKFGTIYSQNYGNDILDPLPHDKKYFESHLDFVKNYFVKVSKGNLNIEYTVLPDTFSVSQRMRNYSPAPGSDDFTPIANFSVEAWTKADQLYPGFAFSDYDVFLIFHAGVGRDISLPGSIGNERDLPSVYLSDKAFKEIYGETYEGIPVSGGSFKITNSMIIPETESREVETISGTFLFEITINGLLCASVGSHLGLPDLFDTETGLSAIGRFGLMDGQSIFAYLGVFPPEPSPWEKIYLGWAEPVTLEIENADVSLVTNLAATISDTVILKVPLNSSEYYLIENRIRDAYDNGSTITYTIGDVVITKTFPNDTTGYRSFDVDSLSGVIIDVDEFDWAVPGNGIVIWHIDENVINEKIAENKVNTDKNRRGVDIEEADGVQDIGEVFFTIFGDQVIGEGTEEDFWHKDNPATLFKNRFSKDTRPNTLTNTGANSLITIKDFSEIDNRMSFRVEFGDSVVKPISSYEFNLDLPIKGFSFRQSKLGDFNIVTRDSLIIVSDDFVRQSLFNFSTYRTVFISDDDWEHTYGVTDSSLNYYVGDFNLPIQFYFGSVNVVKNLSTPIVINQVDENDKELIFGDVFGNLYFYNLADVSLPFEEPTLKLIDSFSYESSAKKIAANGSYFAAIYRPNPLILEQTKFLFEDVFGESEFDSEIPVDLVVTRDEVNHFSIVLTNKNNFFGFRGSEVIFNFSVNAIDTLKSFSLTDLKQDGTNYIAINNGSNIEVYNFTGAMADNFPFTDPEGIGFIGTPLTLDFEGDSKSEIISVTKDGRIFAIDGGTGKVVPGFPISCGGSVSVTPVLYNANGVTNLAVLNDQNVLSAWSISSVEGKLYWSEEFGNPQNTSFIDAAENTNRINEFFPANRAYNYPNPVYEGSTNIRYYVAEDSKINIKIFDLAGDFVAELNDEAQGGMDNETVWNVGDIQSGVYLARIEANSTGGKTEQAVIKIAVVK
jgi:M6 family metalloprotease-like protein